MLGEELVGQSIEDVATDLMKKGNKKSAVVNGGSPTREAGGSPKRVSFAETKPKEKEGETEEKNQNGEKSCINGDAEEKGEL